MSQSSGRFEPYLMSGEQIMWEGESHKEGPPANTRENQSLRFFAILWTAISAFLFTFIIVTQIGDSKMQVSAWASVIVMAVLFVGIGIGLLISTFHFTHEYYCVTDKRFIKMSDKGVIKKSAELSHILSAELTGIKNGYGSISMKTDIVHRSHSNGHSHTHREYWNLQGIEDPSECFRLITGVLQINDEYRFIK